MNWYVLYVKARQEKLVAQMLQNINIEVFCPFISETRQWSDRQKQVEVPLFKSYVFVRLEEKNRHSVFTVPGIVRYLFWLGRPAVVREEEIVAIKKWLQNDRVEEIRVSRLASGQEIVFKEGLLRNKKAVIHEIGTNRIRLILQELNMVLTIKVKDVEQQLARY